MVRGGQTIEDGMVALWVRLLRGGGFVFPEIVHTTFPILESLALPTARTMIQQS